VSLPQVVVQLVLAIEPFATSWFWAHGSSLSHVVFSHMSVSIRASTEGPLGAARMWTSEALDLSSRLAVRWLRCFALIYVIIRLII